MNNAQPIFDPATGYRVDVQGRVDVEWLQSFDSSIEILSDERGRQEFTVFHVHTDQSGMIGLIRRLHGLGLTILIVKLITGKEE